MDSAMSKIESGHSKQSLESTGRKSGGSQKWSPDPNDDCDSPVYKSDAFRMYCFKILPCSKRYCHDWTTCPFAHPGEKAKRRDPRTIMYTGIACSEMKKNMQCSRGDSCPHAHNVFEYWLHPSRYRSQLCNDGINCKRKVCFFAHKLEELRPPSVKPLSPDMQMGANEDPFASPSAHSGSQSEDSSSKMSKDQYSTSSHSESSNSPTSVFPAAVQQAIFSQSTQKLTSSYLEDLARMLIHLQALQPGGVHNASLLQALTSLCQAHAATQQVVASALRQQQEQEQWIIAQQLQSYMTQLLASYFAQQTLSQMPAAQMQSVLAMCMNNQSAAAMQSLLAASQPQQHTAPHFPTMMSGPGSLHEQAIRSLTKQSNGQYPAHQHQQSWGTPPTSQGYPQQLNSMFPGNFDGLQDKFAADPLAFLYKRSMQAGLSPSSGDPSSEMSDCTTIMTGMEGGDEDMMYFGGDMVLDLLSEHKNLKASGSIQQQGGLGMSNWGKF